MLSILWRSEHKGSIDISCDNNTLNDSINIAYSPQISTGFNQSFDLFREQGVDLN